MNKFDIHSLESLVSLVLSLRGSSLDLWRLLSFRDLWCEEKDVPSMTRHSTDICQFLLSKWYTRRELGLRTAILYCGNIISNAFGALLASGILAGLDGKLGHAAWRYVA